MQLAAEEGSQAEGAVSVMREGEGGGHMAVEGVRGGGITIAVLILATEVQAVVDLPTVLVVIVGIKESTMACQMVLKETVLVMRSLETPLLRCPLQLD